jgi:uncharacterized protein
VTITARSPSPLRGGVRGGGVKARFDLGATRSLALLAGLCCLLLLCAAPAFAQKFPALAGRIVDEANLLSADDKRALEQELVALEQKSTDQLVVYTTRSLQGSPIEDFGYRLGRHWQIGQQGKNNGAILIVAPSDRKVRIEVGRGLEPQLTDLMTKLIIENAILPAFRRNDFPGGIKAGVRDIRDVLLGDAEEVKQRARTAKKRSPDSDKFMPVAILVILIFFAIAVVMMQSQQTAHPGRVARDRRRGGADPWGSSAGGWGSGGWSGGGWSGGGGGGGFSGGGGDFGGGGSSGSW